MHNTPNNSQEAFLKELQQMQQQQGGNPGAQFGGAPTLPGDMNLGDIPLDAMPASELLALFEAADMFDMPKERDKIKAVLESRIKQSANSKKNAKLITKKKDKK